MYKLVSNVFDHTRALLITDTLHLWCVLHINHIAAYIVEAPCYGVINSTENKAKYIIALRAVQAICSHWKNAYIRVFPPMHFPQFNATHCWARLFAYFIIITNMFITRTHKLLSKVCSKHTSFGLFVSLVAIDAYFHTYHTWDSYIIRAIRI